jgi:hypothetical protein
MKGALITGTTVSLAVTALWAWMSAVTIGPAAPLYLTWRHPARSYLLLAAAPTGNGWELFAVIAAIFAACFLAAGLRRSRRTQTASLNGDDTE